jgi:CheY-like chemotaxis protein
MTPFSYSLEPVQVLLVEDEAGDILLIRQTLADEAIPISLRVAMDGRQAVEILSRGQFKPDVVILDLKLPKLSGIGFLEGYRPQAPVVVFTSSSNIHDRERAFQLGVKDYIEKPTDLDEYMRIVSQIVRTWAVRAFSQGA